ncbi:MAG: phage tail tape measure protein [Spirochaetales bacterium]|nr:phage tail tape measure protein [Spirochaetales bacterium]
MNFTSSITLMFKDAFSTGFSQARNSLAGMKSALGEINRNQEMNRLASDLSMMTSATEPMRQALSTALDEPSRIAGNLDSSLKNIQAVTGNTAKEMAGIRRELLAVGGDAVGGPQQVAAVFFDIASGVSNVSSRMATLKKSVAMAEAGQAGLAVATGGMIKVMNAYNYSAEQAGFAADVFTRTVGKGVGSMDEFVSAMSPIAGLTASVGIQFDKVGQMMAFITSKGQTASAASTQLKAAITSLLNPNSQMIKLLQSMGMESGSMMMKQYGLAGSLSMIKDALGGSQDAMAQVLGSQESLQAAIALTQEGFKSFAADFADNMEGVTERARAVQLESIEAKMARLDAASTALKAQIGNDINQIRGFFIDMKTGFLNNVVAPIMNSDVGPVFSKIAAFAGMGAKAILDMGGSVLNTAAQLSVLTANISNAGGIVKLFKSTLGLLSAPFKGLAGLCKTFVFRLLGIGGASATAAAGTGAMGTASAASAGGIGVATGATTAFGASLWATLWPILAVVGAIALIAGGVYLLIKNWKSVSSFFGNLWNGVTRIFTSAWNGIKKFFSNLWNGIVGIFNKAKEGILTVIFPFIGFPLLIIKNWNSISSFFGNLWKGIVSGFTSAWNGITNFFTNLWEGIKSIFTGFIDWLKGPIDAIGDIIGGIGDFFGGIFGKAKDSGSGLNDAFANGIKQNTSVPGQTFGKSLQAIDSQLPHSDAKEGPLSRLTESGKAFLDTFTGGMDIDSLKETIKRMFSHLFPDNKEHGLVLQGVNIPAGEKNNTHVIHIEKLYVQADDIQSVMDFIKVLMDAAKRPENDGGF